MMVQWQERPQELRSLFNPAFCSLLVVYSIKEYRKTKETQGMELAMANLLLPLSLHTVTRNTLPSSTKTSFTSWLKSSQEIQIGLAERIASFKRLTNEAIRFAIAAGNLKLDDEGRLDPVARRPRQFDRATSASKEVENCFVTAKIFGRWFARVPNSVFLYQQLRIRP